jgi:hypothetical protein
MKKQLSILIIILFVSFIMSACSQSDTLRGTYTLDNSGILGGIASAVGALNSLTFSGDTVTVDVGGGVAWSGTYVLDGASITISPENGGAGLSGKVSDDKQTITIASLKYVKN